LAREEVFKEGERERGKQVRKCMFVRERNKREKERVCERERERKRQREPER
jgi:hypothetical protein